MWVKTEAGSYLPIHKIVKALGDQECCVLPFLHALSGKDDTSFIYNLGKRVMWKAHKSVDCALLAEYADGLPEQNSSQTHDVFFKVFYWVHNTIHCKI